MAQRCLASAPRRRPLWQLTSRPAGSTWWRPSTGVGCRFGAAACRVLAAACLRSQLGVLRLHGRASGKCSCCGNGNKYQLIDGSSAYRQIHHSAYQGTNPTVLVLSLPAGRWARTLATRRRDEQCCRQAPQETAWICCTHRRGQQALACIQPDVPVLIWLRRRRRLRLLRPLRLLCCGRSRFSVHEHPPPSRPRSRSCCCTTIGSWSCASARCGLGLAAAAAVSYPNRTATRLCNCLAPLVSRLNSTPYSVAPVRALQGAAGLAVSQQSVTLPSIMYFLRQYSR